MEAKKQLKHLIICCNPNPKSLSAAYKEAVMELTEMSGNAMNVRDLYNIGFHPVLEQSDFDAVKYGQIPEEVKVEQDYIQWADLLTFIYPIWWTGMPIIRKSKFPWFPERSVQFSGKRTKRSVQKKGCTQHL